MASKNIVKRIHSNMLKPWTAEKLEKSDEHCRRMLQSKPLIDLYKCMGNVCSFTTNDSAAMERHLNGHGDSRDVLVCAYCTFAASETRLLLQHTEDHVKCRFQCGFCFYRALDAGHVVHHQHNYHKSMQSFKQGIIILPHRKIQPKVDYKSEICASFQRRRKSLECSICNTVHASIAWFADHIKTHGGSMIECPVCSSMVDKRMVQVHLLNHRIDHYECVYCTNGYSSKLGIQRHLSDMHFLRSMYCCMKMKRYKNKHDDVYVLENLRIGVSGSQLVVGGFLTDGASSAPSNPPASESGPSVVERPNLMDLPKIVRVQGAIQMPDNGVTVDATVTRSENIDGPPKVVSSMDHSKTASTLPIESSRFDSIVEKPKAPNATCDTIRVKDFRFIKTTISSTVQKGNLVPRKRVKITQLQDGSMILKLPSTSNPVAMKSFAPCKPISSTSAQGPNVLKLNVKPSAAYQQVNGITETARAAYGHFGNSSMVPTFPKGITVTKGNASLDGNSSSEHDKNNDADTHDDDDDDDDDDDRAGEDDDDNDEQLKDDKRRSLPEPKNIPFYLVGFDDVIENYANVLEAVVLSRKKCGKDFFVCGVPTCTDRFTMSNALKNHMRQCHPYLGSNVDIACKLCNFVVQSIALYIEHLNIHTLENFICFLCPYNHFLLKLVVEHMKDIHQCTSVRLSFAHPRRVNLLKDIVVVIPVGLSRANIKKEIHRVITASHRFRTVTNLVTFPKQSDCRELYKCGFCSMAVPCKLSFKKHILLCTKNNPSTYECAHCDMRFENWMQNLSELCKHLYFHGENLYQCSLCNYIHYDKFKAVVHLEKHGTSEARMIRTIRESKTKWVCNMCSYMFNFMQGVMEHMQNTHDLPCERYLCSICDIRLFTESESVDHCLDQHSGEKVTIVELYHQFMETKATVVGPSTSSSVTIDCRNFRDVSFVKANSSNAKELDTQLSKERPALDNKQHESSAEIIGNTLGASDCNNTSPGNINAGVPPPPSNEANLEPETRKRKSECLNDELIGKIKLEKDSENELEDHTYDASPVGSGLECQFMPESSVESFRAKSEKHVDIASKDDVNTVKDPVCPESYDADLEQLPTRRRMSYFASNEDIENSVTVRDGANKDEGVAYHVPISGAEVEMNNRNDCSVVDPKVPNASLVELSGSHDEVLSTSNSVTLAHKGPNVNSFNSTITSSSTSSSQRRTSRRVAVKADAYKLWHESMKFCCHKCETGFDLFADLHNHWMSPNDGGGGEISLCNTKETNPKKRFRLLAVVRCFYCNEPDTYGALSIHCREKHSYKQFVCVDYWDSFKCGLCLYRNGSGNEKEFWNHFNRYHIASSGKFTVYEHISEDFCNWALAFGKNTLINATQPTLKAVQYICNHCYEEHTDEVSMGMHVAKHLLTFKCIECRQEYKHLKVLYYHYLAIHHTEVLVVSSSWKNDYDEQLLEVQMVFENGLVLSKREAQHTSVSSLQVLKEGFQLYHDEQVRNMETYREALLLPIFTDDEDMECSVENTCKTFIQNQTVHPLLALECCSSAPAELDD